MNDFIGFLSKVLNKEVLSEMPVSLSSAQRLKVHAWLMTKNTPFNEGLLSSTFRPKDIFAVASPPISSATNQDSEFLSYQIAKIDSLVVGIDLQFTKEIHDGELLDPKGDPLLSQIFTFREISYAQAKQDALQTLTGIFCAKEAIIKCGLTRDVKDIEISHDHLGKPFYPGYALSISHSKDYAIAIAVKYDDHTNQLVNQSIYQNPIDKKSSNFKYGKLRPFDKIVILISIVNLAALIFLLFK